MAAVVLAMGWPLNMEAANKNKTVTSVRELMTVTEDLNVIVNGATPFTEEGVVDLVNTEHAVLIVAQKKPSEMLELMSHVKINGKAAKNGTNCQVKLYNRGSIILPYGDSTKPLTCYTEPNFQGTEYNTYSLGHQDGYMKTLTNNQLKNKIRSFKLKRGYMVTFATQDGGRGYSRCFIAADKDLEMKELPLVLDQKINSYRIFKWYDAGKKQLANEMNKKPLTALNVQSSYDWGQGNDSFAPDIEWVPNHIYEDWPTSATIGSTNQSPHCKNNNEPRNSSDDHPQDLQTILDNWENMMRTGLRLCSPASWDGSDYWNATGFLAQFLDSIDARGWRCDIIDLHCYWPESNFGNIANWYNKYKRPIWISEWCWGASWNRNGAFATGVTQSDVKSALQRICSNLNGWDYVERYFYWNGEAVISRLYDYNDDPKYPIYDNGLTPAGEYYAGMTSPIGYDGKHDFVPKNPPQYGPSNYKETIVDGKITKIQWRDSNGEYNQTMEIHKKGANGWVVVNTPKQKETASNYTYTIETPEEGAQYRVYLVDLNGKKYYTGDDKTPAVSAIRLPNATKTMVDGLYTLDGRYVDSDSPRAGVYIKVSGGQASKHVVK
jgi:hypothetical protein